MSIVILYGTESGNAELVADDLVESIDDHPAEAFDMSDFDPADLDVSDFVIVVCSTYGDGELPSGAVPFHDALTAQQPDLTGLRYAVFGMGDSSYEATYSRGSEIIDGQLTALGAVRVGEYGRHDASGRTSASEAALAWSAQVLELVDGVVTA